MVDKSIGELVAASQINDNDLFVLEQSGEAKKLLGILLKQYITRNVMSVSVSALPPDSEPTVSYDPNTGTLELGIPRGEKGESGESSAGYVSGIVKGNGIGGVSAAVAGTDFAAMTNLHGRNLLDNPFFTVNQRGQSSYNSGYTVDRWKITLGSMTVTVNEDGTLTLTNNGTSAARLSQIIEKDFINRLVGNKLAASVDVVSVTGVVSFFLQEIGGSYLTPITQTYLSDAGITEKAGSITTSFSLNCAFYMQLESGASVTLRAVKLELGSVSTLANDTEPNYAEELAKCQRYFYKASVPLIGGISYESPIGYGMMLNSTVARILVPTPVAMRGTPSASLTGADLKYICVAASHLPVNSFEVRTNCSDGIIVYCTVAGGTANAPCVLAIATSNAAVGAAEISFSADL